MIRPLTLIGCVCWALSTVSCSGCHSDDTTNQGPIVIASAKVKAPSAPVASAAAEPTAWPVPVGPALAVLPGKGVGSVRFGATIATIERLMEFPCEVKTETLCGYNGRAIDFILSNGAVTEIHLHRVDRTDPHLPGAKYGVFNGRLLSGAALGMLRPAALEFLGAAQRIEQVADGGPWGTVERHHFPDMVVEFDKVSNGTVILGGVVLTAPATPAASTSGAPAPAASNKHK